MEKRTHTSEKARGWRVVGRFLSSLWRDIRGQDLTEYALLLVLLSLGAVSTMPKLACEVACVFELTADAIEKARQRIPPGQQMKCSRQC